MDYKRVEQVSHTSQKLDLLHAILPLGKIVNSAFDAIILIGLDQKIILFNHGAEALFGYADKEVIGQPLNMLLPEGVKALHRQHVDNFSAQRDVTRLMNPPSLIVEVQRKDGTLFWAEATITKSSDGIANHTVMAVFMRDVTERRTREEDLRRLATQLEALRALDRAILAAVSEEEIAQIALTHLRKMTGYARGSVLIFDEKNNSARVIAVNMAGNTGVAAGHTVPLAVVEAERFRHEDYLLYNDLRTKTSLTELEKRLLEEGFHAILNIPLRVGEETIGTLNLGERVVGFFTEAHIQVACEIGVHIAIALRQAQLGAQVVRHAHELEQRVVARTAELHAEKERVEAILNSSSDALILTGVTSGIQQTNRAFDRLFAAPPDSYRGRPLISLTEPADSDLLEKALATARQEAAEAQRLEIHARRLDGTLFYAEISLARLTMLNHV